MIVSDVIKENIGKIRKAEKLLGRGEIVVSSKEQGFCIMNTETGITRPLPA